ncbi:MAG: Phage DNA polymerase-related protein [Candidatus Curtissbacteria bacterium GW2011_GWA1_40_16]|uniref:Type-4 uracil-DNA glycosylase n=1 Tax=Candidatus Curtissbacteria bacterium GW2011_GWA1_40_16 TaxID=1618405 RepID=A0A0G0UJ04_9BACT|nr:MAG: Phage DNA polymerase-related protein [Candidatus Curtissbacteria bacterium GW2011_GWA1_40_16]
MSKRELLNDLKKRMEDDKSLPLRTGATQLVFGEGNPDAQVYFLGEAPGYYEDREGRPFVGQAGKLLDQLIESIGFSRSEVYISNVVRFRPPANRDPEPDEIAAFSAYVDEEIEIINPRIIVTLGRFSMAKFLPDTKISAVHGKVYKVGWNNKKQVVVPMYHPAAALRSTAILVAIKGDFQIIKKALNDDLEFMEKDAGADDVKDEGKQLDLFI